MFWRVGIVSCHHFGVFSHRMFGSEKADSFKIVVDLDQSFPRLCCLMCFVFFFIFFFFFHLFCCILFNFHSCQCLCFDLTSRSNYFWLYFSSYLLHLSINCFLFTFLNSNYFVADLIYFQKKNDLIKIKYNFFTFFLLLLMLVVNCSSNIIYRVFMCVFFLPLFIVPNS